MAGTAHTRQLCGWLGQSHTLLTSIHRPASDHILHSGFDVSGEPDIPKLSAGKGLSSLTMNSSTRHQHSSREVFVGKWKRHHGRVGIAGMLCHHLTIPIGFKFESSSWLHVWEFLMASRVRKPCVFLRLSLLECFTCLYLHPYWSASPGF